MSDTSEAGDETEMTPEMIRAGIDVKRRYEWDENDGDEERFLKNVFLAMYAAKPEGASY